MAWLASGVMATFPEIQCCTACGLHCECCYTTGLQVEYPLSGILGTTVLLISGIFQVWEYLHIDSKKSWG